MDRLGTLRDIAVIDFETYYAQDYTLSKQSTTEYIQDPRFQVIGVSVIDRGVRHWMEERRFAEFAGDWRASKRHETTGVICHHTHFDGGMMAWRYGMHALMWFDTLSMSRAVHGAWAKHDLDSLAARYGMHKMFMPPWAKGLRREQMTQAQWDEYGVYSVNDSVITGHVFEKMWPHMPANELRHIDTTIRMYTEPQFVLDEALCNEVIKDELEHKYELLRQLGMVEKDLASSPKFCLALMQLGVEIENKNGKNGPIPAIAKSDPFMQGLLESDDEDIRILAEARLAVKSTLNVTRARRFLTLGRSGNPLPVYIGYGKAHTYRWAGADSINWQNLERANKTNPKKGRIRKAICAPPGKVIVVRDSSQVEPRFVAWLTGQDDLTEAFRQGRDVYSEQASKFYRRHVDRKKVAEDEVPGFVGKVCVLGLGYGMGFVKLALELLKGAMGGKPVQFTEADIEMLDIDVDAFIGDGFKMERLSVTPTRLDRRAMLAHAIVCDYFVEQYRAVNSNISGYGKWLEKEIFPLIAAGIETPVGPNGAHAFQTMKDAILLPSGLKLRYNNLRLHGKKWIYDTERGVRSLYGGKAIENITQADCRIIVADQMGQIVRHVPVNLMSHDEIVSVVPEELGQRTYVYMGEVMKRSPKWAPGLPLASEGGVGKRYGDIK